MSLTIPECSTIAAIIPYYNSRGDSTSIITTEGRTIDSGGRIRAVISHLARKTAVDLAALRQQSGNTKHCILQPLALAPGFVLFPVKVRVPKVPGDPSIGYVNLYATAGIAPSRSHNTQITLHNGRNIVVLWTAATVKKHMQQAQLAAAYSPHTGTNFCLQEQGTAYDPALANVVRSLTDLFYNIIKLKTTH